MIGFAAERLMDLEVGGQTGAAYGEKSPERTAQRNGYSVVSASAFSLGWARTGQSKLGNLSSSRGALQLQNSRRERFTSRIHAVRRVV